MQKLKDIAKSLNILPKLRLGEKLPGGGVKPTGPHRVKFVSEPTVVMGKDEQGKPRKELRFEVEENGNRFRWNVPVLSKEGQPSYLIERLMDVEIGDERVLEMSKKGIRNYIDVRPIGVSSSAPAPHQEEEETIEEEDDEEIEIPVKEGDDTSKVTDEDLEQAGLGE